jgi:hypothetical protein
MLNQDQLIEILQKLTEKVSAIELELQHQKALTVADRQTWVNVQTATYLLGKNDPRSVYNLIKNNAVKWRRDGKQYFVNRKSIDAYIDGLKHRNIYYSPNSNK